MKKPPFYKSLLYSIKGVFWMLKSERNFQLEVLALIVNLFLIVYFEINSTDAALIILVCFLVLITEALNTAVEKICDFVEPNFNKKIGLIKDIAAGAVILATFLSIIVGVLVYSNYFFNSIFNHFFSLSKMQSPIKLYQQAFAGLPKNIWLLSL
jgi:diacylglycerol kinase (ATP)